MAKTNHDVNATSRPNGTRDRAAGAVGSIDGAPLAAVVAGVVLGAVAGALLPRTDKETELLGPVGSKIGQAAAEAAKAARDAGKNELGLTGEVKTPMDLLVDKAVGAVTAAGAAASSSVSSKHDG